VFLPVLAPMAVIWKDCAMAACLVLGTAGLLAEGRRRQLAGLAALALATAFRYHALAATLPLVVLLWPSGAVSASRRPSPGHPPPPAPHPAPRPGRRLAIAAGAWLAITAVAFGANAVLTDRKAYAWQSSLAVLDLAGTLARVDGTLPDDELANTLAGTELLADRDLHAAIRRQYALCREHGMTYEPLIVRDGHL